MEETTPRFFVGDKMDLASALVKQIIIQQDVTTWTNLRKNYLPPEFFALYDRIASFIDRFEKVPTFEELKYDAKGKQLQQKIAVVELVEVEADAETLLEILKSDYTQEIAFKEISKFIDNSVGFESPEDCILGIQSIIEVIEKNVDIDNVEENMQTVELFDTDEAMEQRIKLGLNAEFDSGVKFKQDDYILIGGRRGAGKSVVCSNIAIQAYEENKPSLTFTIEMNTRETLQRMTSIGAKVNHHRLKNKNLSPDELHAVAKWWSSRYIGGDSFYEEYYDLSIAFDDYHKKLSKLPLKDNRFEIIYDPELTVAKIKATLERKMQVLKPAVVIIDYVNQVKLDRVWSKKGQYDWTEQIEVSKFLKSAAQKYNVPIISPYQIDASGEARFSKGILDSADAAFVINAHKKDDAAISLTCTKMRGQPETDFCSYIDWDTLRIGPENGVIKEEEEDVETADDTPW